MTTIKSPGRIEWEDTDGPDEVAFKLEQCYFQDGFNRTMRLGQLYCNLVEPEVAMDDVFYLDDDKKAIGEIISRLYRAKQQGKFPEIIETIRFQYNELISQTRFKR